MPLIPPNDIVRPAISPINGARARTPVVVAFGIAIVVVMLATRQGIGVTPDSTQYLSAATNLLDGNGLRVHWWDAGTQPLTHFPPGYALVLGALMRLGALPEAAALWVNALALLATTLLAFTLGRLAGGSRIAGIAGAFAVALSRDVLAAHAMMWSEPLFIALSLGALLATVRAIAYDSVRYAVLAGLLAGFAGVARYVAPALIGACGLSLLVLGSRPVRRRISRALAFSVTASIPLGAVLRRNATVSISATNRDPAFHPLGAPELLEAARTAYHWLVPMHGPWWIELIAVIAIGATAAWLALATWRSRRAGVIAPHIAAAGHPMTVLGIFVASYLGFLALTITFADAQTALNARLLAPVVPVLLLLLVALLIRAASRPRLRTPVLATSAALTLSAVASTATWLLHARRDGLAYNAVAWKASPVVQAIASLPTDAVVYSNHPGAILYLTGREALGIPREFNPNSRKPYPDFVDRMRAACAAAAGGEVFYAHFNEETANAFLPTLAEARSYWHSAPRVVAPDGVLDSLPRDCMDRSGQ